MRKPKSYSKMLDEVVSDFMKTAKVEDLHTGSVVKEMLKQLEADLFYGCPHYEVGVRDLLSKLGVKSAEATFKIYPIIT